MAVIPSYSPGAASAGGSSGFGFAPFLVMGGSLLSGFGAMEGYRDQARGLRKRAGQVLTAGALRERSIREGGEEYESAARARIGASGAATEGSPMEVLLDTARKVEREIYVNRMNTQWEYDELLRQEKAAKKASRLAPLGSFLGGAGSAAALSKK